METCCNSGSSPQVFRVESSMVASSHERILPPKEAPVQLLDSSLCAVPPSLLSDVRASFADLRERQEQLFKEVIDRQKEFQWQLAGMHAACKANIDSQAALVQKHEDFIVEFREFSSSSRTALLTNQIIGQSGTENVDEKVVSAEAQRDNDDEEKPEETPEAHLGRRDSQTRSGHLFRQMSADKIVVESLRTRVGKWLKCKELELAIATCILLNAFILCWESQYLGLNVGFDLQYPGRPMRADQVWQGATTVFAIFEWLFGCLFAVEMMVKLFCWRHQYFYCLHEQGPRRDGKKPSSQFWYYFGGVQGWNLLDGVCVGAFLFSKGWAVGEVNPQMVRMLRLIRLGRLVRLLRFLETLDHLYVMTTAIYGLKQVLCWAILLLTIMLMTCDLLLVQVLHATYFDGVQASDLDEKQLLKHHEMYSYFGTTTRCMLSMYEITLGNWPPIARLLSEEVSEWFTLICLTHKLTIGFAVIGVITGVILQETFKVAQTDDLIMFRQKNAAKAIYRNKFQALFDALDESRDGRLDLSEVEAIGDLPDIKVWLGSLGIETTDLRTLFDLVDIDADGYITIDELVARMPRIQGTARSLDVLALQKQLWRNTVGAAGRAAAAHSGGMKGSFADFLLETPNTLTKKIEEKRSKEKDLEVMPPTFDVM